MTITITPKADRKRELTHAETVVETNSKGQQLCRPKYGFRWTIQDNVVAIGRTEGEWTKFKTVEEAAKFVGVFIDTSVYFLLFSSVKNTIPQQFSREILARQ